MLDIRKWVKEKQSESYRKTIGFLNSSLDNTEEEISLLLYHISIDYNLSDNSELIDKLEDFLLDMMIENDSGFSVSLDILGEEKSIYFKFRWD